MSKMIKAAAKKAAALAFAVTLFEWAVHAARGVQLGPLMPHLAIDVALCFPFALFACVVGARWGPRNTFANAMTTGSLFCMLLAMGMKAHEAVHNLGRLPLVIHLHSVEPTQGFGASLKHGLVDAAYALPVAVLVLVAVPAISRIPRRVRLSLLMSVALAAPFSAQASGSPIVAFAVPLPIPATISSADITLTAQQTPVQILSGTPTNMLTFDGTFPGPTIRRPSGQTTRITVVNQLPASAGGITLHQHGNHSASSQDGQPDDLIPVGSERTYTYDFIENGGPERGAMQWYHDHRMGMTGQNVWMGLAGMVILDDPAEASIDAQLPNGAADVPIMITDRTFDAGDQIPYNWSPEGVRGDTILANGAPSPYFEVANRKYRLRLLNASNSRLFDFAMGDGQPLVQIASESGLLPAPVSRSHIVLGPAERAEVIVDFNNSIGTNIVLRNLLGSGPLSQVMQFRVIRSEADPSIIPSTLRPAPVFSPLTIAADRTWVLGRDIDTGMWTINGKGYDHDRVDARPILGTTERWTFVNSTSVDHIVHIHDVDWKVIARSGPLPPNGAADLMQDPGESGLKESFRLRGNEVVTVESTFTDHLGRFVWHCHMLEHEDFAMMTQFEVVPPG
ncbi:MAG: multicopper oxidase family protein [Actinomycetota bacterium]|nr:multicopper oxidase family protein [Actinomycetota bacterium]